MPRNPVGWFEIYVQDMPRATAFYAAVLGLPLSPLPAPEGADIEMMAFPMGENEPGAAGALVKMEGMGGTGAEASSVLVYFSCDDCGVEAGRVAAAGGTLEQDKTAIGDYGFMALVRDPEGNLFGLHSQI